MSGGGGGGGPDTSRDPCPYRILSDAGGAFSAGCVGGALWHGARGLTSSSPLSSSSLTTALSQVTSRAPAIGGAFGAWAMLFSAFDCGVAGLRGREDPWNTIAAGTLAGGALAIRGGVRVAGRSALGGAVLVALIEGVGVGVGRVGARAPGGLKERLREALVSLLFLFVLVK